MHFPSNNKRRHLDYHKVNPGAHDTSSWWIIRLLSLLIVRSCALLAAVASASNRVIAPKLERQQNKMKKGGEKGIRGFLCSHPLPFLASFLLSSQHSQRTRTETLATQGIWLFVFLSFFLFLLCFFFTQFCGRVWDATIKPIFDGHSGRIDDWPLNTGLTILKVAP